MEIKNATKGLEHSIEILQGGDTKQFTMLI